MSGLYHIGRRLLDPSANPAGAITNDASRRLWERGRNLPVVAAPPPLAAAFTDPVPDPLFDHLDLATKVGIGIVVGFVGAWVSRSFNVRERQRLRLRERQRDFFSGPMLEPRLRAELMFLLECNKLCDMNFKQMYQEGISFERYRGVAVVLNFFRLINAYKVERFIREHDAREGLGWPYAYWWSKVIEPYSKGLHPHDRRNFVEQKRLQQFQQMSGDAGRGVSSRRVFPGATASTMT